MGPMVVQLLLFEMTCNIQNSTSGTTVDNGAYGGTAFFTLNAL